VVKEAGSSKYPRAESKRRFRASVIVCPRRTLRNLPLLSSGRAGFTVLQALPLMIRSGFPVAPKFGRALAGPPAGRRDMTQAASMIWSDRTPGTPTVTPSPVRRQVSRLEPATPLNWPLPVVAEPQKPWVTVQNSPSSWHPKVTEQVEVQPSAEVTTTSKVEGPKPAV